MYIRYTAPRVEVHNREKTRTSFASVSHTKNEHGVRNGQKDLTNQVRTSGLEMIIQLQSHALPTELW